MGGGIDYVIQVKGNQRLLFNRIKEICTEESPGDTHYSVETKRGRTCTRETRVYDHVQGIDEGWVRIQRIIQVTRSGRRKGKAYHSTHYYISSKPRNDAVYFAEGIRSHWGIENRLHWVKDKVMQEDSCRIRTPRIVSNLSLIRAAVISLYRIRGIDSITKATEQYAHRLDACLSLISDPLI